MAICLLKTKMFIPTLPISILVERSQLYSKLDTGLHKKLMLISAPAGFGKSTLVSSWIKDRQIEAAWVSLDSNDNDPHIFWQYVLAAFQSINPQFGHDAGQIIRSPQVQNPQPVLVSMLNEISQQQIEFTLVLDDYHLIESANIHESLSFFLEYIPKKIHIILLTRVDPPFSLGKLRVQGELTELRASDLQFTHNESIIFLKQVMNLKLTDKQTLALEKRTEGWVVGLKLAALSLQHHENYDTFIDAFSGSHRYVLDYLTEEVINQLSESLREFLIQTSILDSFCPALCEAVTDNKHSQRIIETFQKDNLFVIPLDLEGKWYRYHHLFIQLLRALLHRDMVGDICDLHLRAMNWFDEHGQFDLAAEHAYKSGDMQAAKAYVLKRWNDMLHQGGVTHVLKWVKRLPPQMTQEDANLALANCWARYLTGQSAAMSPFVDAAQQDFERLQKEGGLTQNELDFIHSQIFMMCSALQISQGAFKDALVNAEKAIACVPQDMGIAVGPAWNLLGAAKASVGDINGGVEAYQNGIEIAYQARNFLSAFAAVFWSTVYMIRQGRLDEAMQHAQQFLNRGEQDGLQKFPAVGLLYVAQALIALEKNQIETAYTWVEKGGGFSEALRYGRTIRARLNLAMGETDSALSIMEDVERIVLATQETYAIAEMHLEWAKIHIQLGKMDAVRQRYEAIQQLDDLQTSHPLLQGSIHWLEAVVAWQENHRLDALKMIENGKKQAIAFGLQGDLLRYCNLQTIILEEMGQKTEARESLIFAIELGRSHGFFRTWLDTGEKICGTLVRLCPLISDDDQKRIYLNEVLTLCNGVFETVDTESGLSAILTEREIDILRLICQGHSNAEIAEHLFVTVNTVKKHTSNIYGKLDVTSRTQAIAKAREIELV